MTAATGTTPEPAFVTAVSSSPRHGFSRPTRPEIRLVADIGVESDAHSGVTVQHRWRTDADPPLNLRQVHLMHAELLALPRGTRLQLGDHVVIELTGLRDPCDQIDGFQDALKRTLLDPDAEGNLGRTAGFMGIVLTTGLVRPGDPISVELPAQPYEVLAPV